MEWPCSPTRRQAARSEPWRLLESWFDLAAGVVGVLAGAGLLARGAWAVWLASVAAFGAVGFHILHGGDYETRTLAAMLLRIVIWQAIMVVAWRVALSGFRCRHLARDA